MKIEDFDWGVKLRIKFNPKNWNPNLWNVLRKIYENYGYSYSSFYYKMPEWSKDWETKEVVEILLGRLEAEWDVEVVNLVLEGGEDCEIEKKINYGLDSTSYESIERRWNHLIRTLREINLDVLISKDVVREVQYEEKFWINNGVLGGYEQREKWEQESEDEILDDLIKWEERNPNGSILEFVKERQKKWKLPDLKGITEKKISNNDWNALNECVNRLEGWKVSEQNESVHEELKKWLNGKIQIREDSSAILGWITKVNPRYVGASSEMVVQSWGELTPSEKVIGFNLLIDWIGAEAEIMYLNKEKSWQYIWESGSFIRSAWGKNAIVSEDWIEKAFKEVMSKIENDKDVEKLICGVEAIKKKVGCKKGPGSKEWDESKAWLESLWEQRSWEVELIKEGKNRKEDEPRDIKRL